MSRMTGWLSVGLTVLAAVSGLANAAHGEDLPQVVPSPQRMAWAKEGTPAWTAIDACRRFVIEGERRPSALAAIEQVNARLAALGRPAIRLADNGTDTSGASEIALAVQPCERAERVVRDLPDPRAEGYRLVVGADRVTIVGKDVPGLYYGLMTLRQLIHPDGRIPRVAISDWPDLPVRGTYVGEHHFGKPPETKVTEFASLKLNMVVFEYSQLYHLDDPRVRKHWQDTFALCRRHCIEPVPELQSLGWGHLVLCIEPRGVEGVTLHRRRFEAKDGQILPVPDAPAPAVTLTNPGFEQAEGDDAQGWGQDAVGEMISIDRSVRRGGEASLRIHRAKRGMARAWQDVTCLPNRGYEVACRLKTQDVTAGAAGGAYIEVYGLHPSGQLGALLCKSPHRRGSQDWRAESARFGSGAYKRLRIYVRIQQAIGTAWFDDVTLAGARIASGSPLGNVIITDAAPLTATDAAGRVTYVAGKDYRIVPGDPLTGPGPDLKRTAYPADAKPPRLELLPGGRIRNGDALLLTFTYAPQGSITCCPSEPLYQDAMRKAIHNVVRYLQPKYIHIGHDEPRVFNRDDRCRRRELSNTELFVDDIRRMRRFAREADPNVRLMMWADAANPYHNERHAGMKDTAKHLPRDIVMASWFYSSPQNNEAIERSVAYFTELGFDVTGSPWFAHANAHHWAVCLAKRRRHSPHVLGEIYTSWKDNPNVDPWQALTTTAEYAWSADKPPVADWVKRQRK